ncbi:hypothetical protein, partial [Dokdonella ginsengisoli]
LKGAVNGAVSGAVFGGIGASLPTEGSGALYESGRLSTGGYAVRALTSGVAGGVLSTMQGGRFGAGFASAGLGSALTPVAGRVASNSVGQGFLVAIVGGTASAAGGGKFANGAMSAAFSYAFGEVANRVASQRMEKAAALDPKYSVAHAVVLNDPNGARIVGMSMGHNALLIGGDDSGGWIYAAKEGGDNNVISHFSSLSEFEASETAIRYSRQYLIETSISQDIDMLDFARSNYDSKYDFCSNNCADLVNQTLRAGRVSAPSALLAIPNITYRSIIGLNPGGKAIKGD